MVTWENDRGKLPTFHSDKERDKWRKWSRDTYTVFVLHGVAGATEAPLTKTVVRTVQRRIKAKAKPKSLLKPPVVTPQTTLAQKLAEVADGAVTAEGDKETGKGEETGGEAVPADL